MLNFQQLKSCLDLLEFYDYSKERNDCCKKCRDSYTGFPSLYAFINEEFSFIDNYALKTISNLCSDVISSLLRPRTIL